MSRFECVLCGNHTLLHRYGPVTCSICNSFFRGAISGNVVPGKCLSGCFRRKVFDFKIMCRGCKLGRCLASGMDPKKIFHRPSTPLQDRINTKTDFECLIKLQHHQKHDNRMMNRITIDDICSSYLVQMSNHNYNRASFQDINMALKMGLLDAKQFAKRFESFENLKLKERNLVLSEYGIAYMLIDQAFKTAFHSNDDKIWLLQNDSFLHTELFFKIPVEDMKSEDIFRQRRCHFEFVQELLTNLMVPFRKLKIDVFECMILKILLLLTSLFPGCVKLDDPDRIVSKCYQSLQRHSNQISKENGIERFGEVILLIGNIRCAVKHFYNMTRSTDLFRIYREDQFVNSILLN
ncbi:hypothetical protein B9Z55_020821 [Caenorhabditis nigoni]|uniref:NR LBD domain-containing protein n=1 Tax=Caenorhabditis nigoni TaxID=1611254 RepID=A0A2G5TPV5_9PELO|nr:hypothetical protein B9Z55_020821 [Caenorhabditis nigoni]